MAAPPQTASDRWPAQIKYIVGNEACERFSYYGMLSILAVYITGTELQGGLGLTDDASTTIIHVFGSAVYFMPLLGALLSDKLIGRYHTILWVSLFYCAGHGVLACSDYAGGVHGKLICLFTGLSLIALGAGGIKPCVSAFMGDQFRPDQSHLLQKAYGVFYWTINFGSFFSPLVIPWVKDHHGYSAAFAVPGILMAIATSIFWLGRKKYVRVPPSRKTRSGGFIPVFFYAYAHRTTSGFGPLLNILTTLGAPLFIMVALAIVGFAEVNPVTRAIGWAAVSCTVLWYVSVLLTSLLGKFDPGDQFWMGAQKRYSEKEIAAARSVSPILFVLALVPVFWSLYNQTNSTWVLQGKSMVPAYFLGFKIGEEEMQSMNALLVLIFVPLFTWGIYPHIGRLAAPLNRMAMGNFLAGGSYLFVAALQRHIEHGEQISVLWQTVPYAVITAAEVLVSTTGLEFAFREAAPEMKSLVMAFWLAAIAMGNLFVAVLTKVLSNSSGDNSVTSGRFTQYAWLTFGVAVLFAIVAVFYKYRDQAAARGK